MSVQQTVVKPRAGKKKLIILVIFLIVIDQISKHWATAALPFHEAVGVVPFFSLYLTHNTGVAFSMLSWLGPTGLIIMTLLIVAFMLYLWRKVPGEQQLASVGFALVIAGAMGNLIDRVTLGYVVDYFLVHTDNWAFAVFNVADSYISVGAACIIIDELFSARRKSKPE